MKLPDYSVLMSVYKNEKADYLRIAMNSMWNQTVVTNDFVVICDGPLTPQLDAVLEEMQSCHPDALRVIRLKENRGLGNALHIGVKECKNDLIARMDSDDISKPERCEKQLQVFVAHPEISIVSAALEEFSEIEEGQSTPSKIIGVRRVPESPDEVAEFAKKRSPFNHPVAMYRKKDILAAGNYQDFYHLEDYYLWVRFLQKGFKGRNLQEPLLWMRAGSEMYKRRSGWKYARSQQKLFHYMKQTGFIDTKQYIKSTGIRTCSAMAPNWLRKRMFKRVLRKK